MVDQLTGTKNSKLYFDIKSTQWPIIFCMEYDITLWGLEKLHPFNSEKWGQIYNYLKDWNLIRDDTTVKPLEASQEDLLTVHTKRYLSNLKFTDFLEGAIIAEWSASVARITEVPVAAILPNYFIQKRVLRPFRFQTGGTILAGKLALERGWAINIGGGFHHCSADRGGGFCAYADITLSIKFLFERLDGISKVMIVDLDAHQGNGHERDFMNDSRVYIMDVYNRGIYPHDGFAKRAIKRRVELQHLTDDEEYLQKVELHLEGALNEFHPDMIVYNAGTDVLQGDPLGLLAVTPQGIIQRDEIVFRKARFRNIPIFMVTSGGYLRQTAQIIAESILNLRKKNLIECDEAENAPIPVDETGVEPTETTLKESSSDGGLFNRFCRQWRCTESSDQVRHSSSHGSLQESS